MQLVNSKYVFRLQGERKLKKKKKNMKLQE